MKDLLRWLMDLCPVGCPRWLWGIALVCAALALVTMLSMLLWFMSTQIQFM